MPYKLINGAKVYDRMTHAELASTARLFPVGTVGAPARAIKGGAKTVRISPDQPPAAADSGKTPPPQPE